MKYILNGLIAIALFSVLTFFFNFLGAEEGLEAYLGLCSTLLVIYLYRKHHGKI